MPQGEERRLRMSRSTDVFTLDPNFRYIDIVVLYIYSIYDITLYTGSCNHNQPVMVKPVRIGIGRI